MDTDKDARDVSITQLVEGNFHGQYVQVSGKIRGAVSDEEDIIGFLQESTGYLKDDSNRFMAYRASRAAETNRFLALFQAASASGIEVTVTGKYSPRQDDSQELEFNLKDMELGNQKIKIY